MQSHGKSPLRQIEQILADVFDAVEVRFHDASGRDIDGGVVLQAAISKAFAVQVRLECGRIEPGVSGGGDELLEGFDSKGRATAMRHAAAMSRQERYDEFVREFARLETEHEFMWAGYVVKQLLPRLGFAPGETKQVLEQLKNEGVITVSKVQNPRNPDFPATAVRLNRASERVQTVLAVGEQTDGEVQDAEGEESGPG